MSSVNATMNQSMSWRCIIRIYCYHRALGPELCPSRIEIKSVSSSPNPFCAFHRACMEFRLQAVPFGPV
jgi:hypothetical protein